MNQSQQSRTNEVIQFLASVGFPVGTGDFRTQLRQERVAHILLAVANLGPSAKWTSINFAGDGKGYTPRSRDIINFINQNYGGTISSGSYDDIRRKNLDFLVPAGLVLKAANRPGADTNDGTRGYAIAPDAVPLFTTYGTAAWAGEVKKFIANKGKLVDLLSRPREVPKVSIKIPSGATLALSTGPHNVLQKVIVESFVPAFVKKPELLYIGDTAKKILFRDDKRLQEIGLPQLEHDMLPDIVVLDNERGWLFLIEAVHSANPITQLRHLTMEKLTAGCKYGKVYVSAFLDRDSFRQWVATLSWETEVWLSSEPTHLIHFNGDRFLGPHVSK